MADPRPDEGFARLLTGEQPEAPAAERPAPAHAWPTGSRFDELVERIPARTRRLLAWAGPAVVLGIAAATRLTGLQEPAELVFDETYYVKDAWATWNLGHESTWPEGANDQWAAGQVDGYTGTASFAVHPPLGKWLIALGMAAFGPESPASWRATTAIIGVLLVAFIMLAAWLLTRSAPLATLAGFLLAIDGSGIVMSRVGLLDIMLAFFLLVAFCCLLLDRERTARTGALWARPWLLLMAVSLGLACSIKWSGIWYVAAFGLAAVIADPHSTRSTLAFLQRAASAFLLVVPVALLTYLATWAGWFASDTGYHRHWAEIGDNAWTGPFAWVPLDLQSWLHFEQVVYQYHVGESRPHSYMSPAWQWLLLLRPTSMYYESSELGDPGCAATSCGASILDIPNPLIWYAGVAAMVFLLVRIVRHRRWPDVAVFVAFGAGYLPWLLYPERTIFFFYTIAFEPYLILALVVAIRAVAGTAADERSRRLSGLWTVAVFLAMAVTVSVYFWPLWNGQTGAYWFVASHWWLPGWR